MKAGTKLKTIPLGVVVATPGVLALVPAEAIRTALSRHAMGDWGECQEEDWRENDLSLLEGFRLLSVYSATDGTKFWVITEADRSATTVLLPDEY